MNYKNQILFVFALFIGINTSLSAQTGLALSLNGVDGYMQVVDHSDLDIDAGENFSATLWFRTSSTSNYFRMLSKRNGPGYEMITQINGGAYGMNLSSSSGAVGPPFGSTNVCDGEWHHIAMIVNTANNTATIYVDGNQENQSTNTGIGTQSFANNTDLLFGTRVQQDIWMPGLLDDVRLWSVALSQAQIQADMTAIVDGSEDDLIAAWDFENVSGNTVPDVKGNHPGTLNGGATTIDPNAPMQFFSANLTQRTIPVGIGEADEGVVAVAVSTIGATDPIDLTALSFNMNGTTDMNDVEQIKIYYTGNSERFSPDNLFATASPGSGTITVSGNQTLDEGANYFWIAYDMADGATEGNFIDAGAISVMVDGNEEALITGTVSGARLIILEHKLLFSGGDFNSVNWRIPAVCTAADGSVVVMADARRDQPGDLPNHIDPVARRSTDNGDTWSDPVTVVDFGGTIGAGDVAMLTDQNTGDIIAIFPSHNGFFQSNPSNPIRTQLVRSTDNGITWSDPVEITSMVNLFIWSGAFSSSGSMNQTREGRIIHGMVVRPETGNNIDAYMIYSDDGGETWAVKPNVVSTTGNESKVVELDNGDLMFNLRNSSGLRQIAVSTDGGDTWGTPYLQQEMPEPGVNGDFIRYTSVLDGYDKSRLLFSVASDPNTRRNLTVFISYDEGQTWGTSKVINPGPSGYSALTVLEDGTIGCFYENGEHESYQLYFARISLDWLSDGDDEYIPVGLKEISSSLLNIQISPNPTSGPVMIELELEKTLDLTGSLYSQSGIKVDSLFKQQFVRGTHQKALNLSHLVSGTYFLNLEVGGKIATRKILKIR